MGFAEVAALLALVVGDDFEEGCFFEEKAIAEQDEVALSWLHAQSSGWRVEAGQAGAVENGRGVGAFQVLEDSQTDMLFFGDVGDLGIDDVAGGNEGIGEGGEGVFS